MIEASDRLHEIQAGEWKGEAGDAFRLLIGEQPAHYERAGSAFAEASRTTARYAEVLREAQFDARRAVTLYEQAEAETKDWKRQWDAHDAEVRAADRAASDGMPSPPAAPQPSHADPGAGDRTAAYRLLDDARDRVAAQARSTARVLQQAEEAAPKKPGLLDSILGGIGDFFGGVWDATIGGIWDSIQAFLDDPGQWVKDVWDNLYDHVAFWDWDTFKNTWIEFGKDFLAWDEWAKNPLRALGMVTANVVLALATLGVGAVAFKVIKRLIKRRKKDNKGGPFPDGPLKDWRPGHPLPNAARATIDRNKFERYSLDPLNPQNAGKWKGFKELGYDIDTPAGRSAGTDDLMGQVQRQLPSMPARVGQASGHGPRLEVDVPIRGPNGKTGTLKTVWQYDAWSETPRLITNWVEVHR